MSVASELRGAKQEHEGIRVHFSPEQNKDLDESSASASRWLKVGYASVVLMGLALLALSLS